MAPKQRSKLKKPAQGSLVMILPAFEARKIRSETQYQDPVHAVAHMDATPPREGFTCHADAIKMQL